MGTLPIKLIQPYPDHSCPIPVPAEDRVRVSVPVYFIRYRYPHHALCSGYDRLCDYIGETIPLSRTLYWLGESVLRMPALFAAKWGGHFEYSRYDYVMEREAIRQFLRHRCSIYHHVYAEKTFRMMARFAGRNGNKIVGTVHHPPEHNAWLFRSLDHFRQLDKIIVLSKSQLAYWQNQVGAEKVTFVPHAVDTAYFMPAEQREDRPPRCLFVGIHERDFDILPEVVSRVTSAKRKTEFVMISRHARCGEISARNARAHWLPWVSETEYRHLLQQSDLLVLPLKRATTNNTVLEALACGVPVLTSRGGIEDYLDSQCSRCFEVGDAISMSQAALHLLENEPERLLMAQAARTRADEFSWKVTAWKMAKVYESLILT